jgi:type II secretory pathway pseudopilin PulG
LIELLVVIAIIGILSGLIVVSMGGVIQKANIAKAQVFSNSLRNSLMANIVSEWKFDDGSSSQTVTKDSWSGGNNGTLNGFEFNTTTSGWRINSQCVSGNCLQFDGSNDYVTFGTIDSNSVLNPLVKDWTYSLWIKRGNVTDYHIVLATGPFSGTTDRMGIYSSGSGVFIDNADGTNRDTLGFTGFTNSIWQYLVMTVDRDGLTKAYIDGVSVNSKTTTISLDITPNYELLIARTISVGSYSYMNGFVDDVRIYNAVILTSQIKEQYYAGLNKLLSNGGITNEEYKKGIERVATK